MHDAIAQWALRLIRERADAAETARKRACKKFSNRRVHKLRTQSRRLRAALEDLCDCLPHAEDLMECSHTVGDATGKVRDATVLIEQLERYHRFSFFEERAEIEKLERVLKRRRKKCTGEAKEAVRHIDLKVKA
ncbi:MAG: CHAD domain-containing protein [Candidatus Eremiobacteraeota bacterium]|nr:CHAD domain-containing protein [Candidatus Eremiobacteraeota bacterium]